MAQRFIPNEGSMQTVGARFSQLSESCLGQILTKFPPRDHYDGEPVGLAGGFTGLAYLYLQASTAYPQLQIGGHDLVYWASQYAKADRGTVAFEKECCGIASERLSLDAIRACISQDEDGINTFLDSIALLLDLNEPTEDPSAGNLPAEMIYGRSGALYLLRVVRHWNPSYKTRLDAAMESLARRIVATDNDGDGDWTWNGTRYFGTLHGDIGIITQIVLCLPQLASRFEKKIESLLQMQTDTGNWMANSSETEPKLTGRVQFCHGAPGFIQAIWSLRPFYPALHDKMDEAIAKGQELTWSNGLLIKEPNLCHGIFGNALSLPRGPKREHFLALAMPTAVETAKAGDPSLFEPADYGFESSLLFSYLPGMAWTFMVAEEEHPRMILFNDV